jgi:hypothetical protein
MLAGVGMLAGVRFQALTVVAMVLAHPTASPAQTPLPTLPTGLQSCVQIPDSAARLACFDREMAQLTASAAASAASANSPSAQAASAPSPSAGPASADTHVVTLTPEQKIGLSVQQVDAIESGQPYQPHKSTDLQVHAHVASVSQRAGGYGVYQLDNGQIWVQTETRSDFHVQPGVDVTVSTGALGSFWISTDAHHATRVKRVR